MPNSEHFIRLHRVVVLVPTPEVRPVVEHRPHVPARQNRAQDRRERHRESKPVCHL